MSGRFVVRLQLGGDWVTDETVELTTDIAHATAV
jgi:hypothetical protein